MFMDGIKRGFMEQGQLNQASTFTPEVLLN